MPELTSEDLWGEAPKVHKHSCRKCGQSWSCDLSSCPISDEVALCYECGNLQFGVYYGIGDISQP